MNYLHTRTYMIGRSGNKTATSAAAYRTGSVVAASAYRANDKITDIKSGKTHDYTRKKGVVFSKIFLPQKAPLNFTDRSKLWNTVEKVENRKNSQFARQWEAALPKEFSRGDQLDLLSKFVEDYFVSQGMIADAAIHDKGDGNPHVHILLTLRRVDENGFVGNKERLWNDRKLADLWRNAWAERCNEIYRRMELPIRIDPRSYKIQQNGLTPTKPIGKVNSQLEKRGIKTPAGDENRRIQAGNQRTKQNQVYDIVSVITPERKAKENKNEEEVIVLTGQECKREIAKTKRSIDEIEAVIEDLEGIVEKASEFEKQLIHFRNSDDSTNAEKVEQSLSELREDIAKTYPISTLVEIGGLAEQLRDQLIGEEQYLASLQKGEIEIETDKEMKVVNDKEQSLNEQDQEKELEQDRDRWGE